MNIVFIDFDDIKNPLLAAGQARATFEVGRRLAAKGHRVTSICSRYPGYKDRTEDGITYIHIGVGSGFQQLNNAMYILSVPFALRRLRADIIVECFTAPITTLCTPLFTRIPVVALPTVFAADSFSQKYKIPFHLIERAGLKTYKYFMPYIRSDEKKMRAVNPTVISRIIGQGVDRSYLRIPRRKPEYILFLGRMDIVQKGIDLLLEAYSHVSDTIGLPLVIAGHGPDEPEVRKLIKRFGLEQKVRMAGAAYGKQKEALLSRAKFVAMPSRYDNLPLFSLEALASGLPLLTFDTEEFSWLEPSFSRKARPFDAIHYGTRMKHMADSHATERMGIEARKYATRHTWEHVADDMERFFTFILQKEGSL